MSDFFWPSGGARRAGPERTPKAPLTRAQIVRAALRLVQAEGIDAVSMRRLAAEFGTGPSSLYAHVSNKDELFRLMFDEMCGLIDVPAPQPHRWKEQIRELARAGHRVMTEHNDLARAALATIPTGPNALRISNGMFGMMLAGGIPPRRATWAMDRIFLYITADAYEQSIWRSAGKTGPYAGMTQDDLVGFFAQLPADRYPHIREHAEAMVGGGVDQRFEFGLELLIDGLDKYATETVAGEIRPGGGD